MSRAIAVHLGERASLVGTLRFDAEGARERTALLYHQTWLRSPHAFAIDPLLPLVPGPHFHHPRPSGSVFPGAIADTEPEGWGRQVIRRDYAKRRNADRSTSGTAIQPPTSLDFLLAVDDQSRLGALRFADEQGVLQRASAPGRRTVPPLMELGHLLSASRAVEMQVETAADLEYLRGRGTSLGGMRPKCTVVDDDGSLSIGKFPSMTDTREVTKGEVLALTLARAAGITAATARVMDSDGIPVALIRRFDRTSDGGRIPYVSAATLLGVDAADATEHTYTEMVDAIRRHGAAAPQDIEELWRRIAFSILISNFDDHLRNHGFLHAGGGLWRLAPAFDLNPCPDRIRELKTWISEDAGPAATIDHLRSVSSYFRITTSRADQIVQEVIPPSVPGVWLGVASACHPASSRLLRRPLSMTSVSTADAPVHGRPEGRPTLPRRQPVGRSGRIRTGAGAARGWADAEAWPAEEAGVGHRDAR